MPNIPARLTNPLSIILVVMLLLVIRVQAALRWRTLSALSALMPCPASPNRCACSNAQSSAEPANRAANSAIAKGSRVGQPEKGVDVSGCLTYGAGRCLFNEWMAAFNRFSDCRSVFQAAIVMNISNAKHRFQLFNPQRNKTTQQPCRHTK